MKKTGLGIRFVLLTAAFVLSAAGIVLMIVCSTMNSAYKLSALTGLTVMAAAGLVLVAVAAAVEKRPGAADILTGIAAVGAIILFTLVTGTVLKGRVLLMSGLFSYNSANAQGWKVFYVTAASAACFLAADLVLILSSFLKRKEA